LIKEREDKAREGWMDLRSRRNRIRHEKDGWILDQGEKIRHEKDGWILDQGETG
jgi:hypothetical protein